MRHLRPRLRHELPALALAECQDRLEAEGRVVRRHLWRLLRPTATLLRRFVHPIRRPRAGVLLVVPAVLSACSYALPLGGTAPGRGRPVDAGTIVVGASVGPMAQVEGTVPEVIGDFGTVVNPVPPSDAATTGVGGVDPLGVAVGLTESIDVGLNRSRGLHAVVRLVGGGAWAVSVTPAFYGYSAESTDRTRARLTNYNVLGLASVDPWPGGSAVSDIYAGAGLNRCSGWIDSGRERRSHAAVVPSLVLGIRLGGEVPDEVRLLTLGAEGQGVWIRQRTGRRDFVPTFRLFLSLGFGAPWLRASNSG